MTVKQFDNLNTSYVSLAALLRYLRGQDFSGSIHLTLDQYEAEIFLSGSGVEAVFEIDKVSGTSTKNDGAIERALVHAREPGGTITVYEGKTEPGGVAANLSEPSRPSFTDQIPSASAPLAEQVDWDELFGVSGVLIAAVERAVGSLPADFGTSFRAARIELGDDYPFLDPTVRDLKYANGIVTLSVRPATSAYVAGLSDCLRRIVNKFAVDKEGRRFRERVAVELAVAARIRPDGLGKFKTQLDRIAGTRVI
jgi:hypothetical protein